MKRLLYIFLSVLSFLTACKSMSLSPKDSSSHPAIAKDLAGKRFVLQTFDGNAVTVPEGEDFELGFDESMQMYAKGCNRFFGTAMLEDGVLKAPQAGSTRMYCAEAFLNDMDTILSSAFTNGAQATIEQGTLNLSIDGHTLSYTPSSTPQEK